MAMNMKEQAVAESVMQSIEAAAAAVHQAYRNTTDPTLKAALRQQWNSLCGLVKQAEELVDEDR